MKTPDEIKKGLECVGGLNEPCVPGCPYEKCCECGLTAARDAIECIQQLESRLAKVERERDAAVEDVSLALDGVDQMNNDCCFCKHKDKPVCETCEWEWRGVCEENTKEDEHGSQAD